MSPYQSLLVFRVLSILTTTLLTRLYDISSCLWRSRRSTSGTIRTACFVINNIINAIEHLPILSVRFYLRRYFRPGVFAVLCLRTLFCSSAFRVRLLKDWLTIVILESPRPLVSNSRKYRQWPRERSFCGFELKVSSRVDYMKSVYVWNMLSYFQAGNPLRIPVTLKTTKPDIPDKQGSNPGILSVICETTLLLWCRILLRNGKNIYTAVFIYIRVFHAALCYA
jgi:hypothetical protein